MRTFALGALLIITPLGFATKAYQGPGQWWVRHHAGALFYEVFWILLAVAVWPRLSPWPVALAVFLVTTALEVLQLWDHPLLLVMRSDFLGRTLFGTTFDWWDIPHYVVGCVGGATLVGLARRRCG